MLTEQQKLQIKEDVDTHFDVREDRWKPGSTTVWADVITAPYEIDDVFTYFFAYIKKLKMVT
jgi:hypothetical protein